MSVKLLRSALAAAVGVSWISAAIFGAYILAFYGGAIPANAMGAWNSSLPRLYEAHTVGATISIGMHFAGGGILLLLGPLQLIEPLRRRWPAVHRWIGRLYALAAALAGIGGLAFIVMKGTIGGMPMNIGFAGYGALVVLAAVQTYRYGRARDLETHRAWAIRLYALAIGSWLYRMDYGLWAIVGHLAGHTRTFSGWFDAVMAFFFYIPNLGIAELVIRSKQRPLRSGLRIATAIALVIATLFIATATVYFTILGWGPGIIAGWTSSY